MFSCFFRKNSPPPAQPSPSYVGKKAFESVGRNVFVVAQFSNEWIVDAEYTIIRCDDRRMMSADCPMSQTKVILRARE